MSFRSMAICMLCIAFVACALQAAEPQRLALDEKEYFSTPGLDVLVFSNTYDGLFSDAKIAGIELIHHGVRTATNGDVRLSPTPEQWDPTPALKARTVDRKTGAIDVRMHYPQHEFEYVIRAEPSGVGIVLKVILDRPLPRALEGMAGFNLEFLPSAYFERSYSMDEKSGVFPLYPFGPTGRDAGGEPTRLPIATGHSLTLAPEDPARRVTIASKDAELGLFDGRNQAQNGWFVVRSLLPAGKQGTVLEWTLSGSTIPGWTRPVVIGHSQVGYHPSQQKVAIIETDPRSPPPATAKLIKVSADGAMTEIFSASPRSWGDYLRYRYYTFDFSSVREPGI